MLPVPSPLAVAVADTAVVAAAVVVVAAAAVVVVIVAAAVAAAVAGNQHFYESETAGPRSPAVSILQDTKALI